MDEEEWRSRLVQVVAQQVRRRRLELGLSVQKLADICTEQYGLTLKRSVLANFEGGRRPALSVVELIVLARILAIPPIELLFPVGRVEETEVLPGKSVPTWDALMWFTGERDSLPTDEGTTQNSHPVQWHREHEQLVDEWRLRRRELEASLRASGYDKLPSVPGDTARLMIDLKEEALRATESGIRVLRADMRKMGLTPPSLGDLASYIEPETSPGQTPPGPTKGEPH